MPAFAVIGGQWGDEGKGKVVDFLSEKADYVVRYSGGNNAGHTVINELGTSKLHLVPAGIFWPHTKCIIANGVVVDPQVLMEELDTLKSKGIDIRRMYISDRAHLIMPYHILLDRMEEESKGVKALGTTGKGVGPAYVDKAARLGMRVRELLNKESLLQRLKELLDLKNRVITRVYGGTPIDLDELYNTCLEWGAMLEQYLTSTEYLLHDALSSGKTVLLEGAQGTMLDMDHGTYPYVTSSSPSVGGAYTGSGMSPRAVVGVAGVFKAYSTRVGAGPLTAEMDDSIGSTIRERAWEYGTTTGRPRRIGWFDAVAARYSAAINDFTSLILTRLDVLDNLPTIKLCIGYKVNGQTTNQFPANTFILEKCEPIFEEMPGWHQPTASATKLSQLPKEAMDYVHRIEELVGCPIDMISTGPKREETILIKPLL